MQQNSGVSLSLSLTLSLSLCVIQAQSVSILTSWCHHTLPAILHCAVHYDMATH